MFGLFLSSYSSANWLKGRCQLLSLLPWYTYTFIVWIQTSCHGSATLQTESYTEAFQLSLKRLGKGDCVWLGIAFDIRKKLQVTLFYGNLLMVEQTEEDPRWPSSKCCSTTLHWRLHSSLKPAWWICAVEEYCRSLGAIWRSTKVR